MLVSDHSCSKCGKSFGSREDLQGHQESVHEKKKPFKCHYCDLRFYKDLGLRKHVKSSHKGQKIKVPTIENAKILKIVKESKSINLLDSDHSCSKCGKCFTSRLELQQHCESVHDKKKQFKCPLCELTFHQEMGLKVHTKLSHKEKKVKTPKNSKIPKTPRVKSPKKAKNSKSSENTPGKKIEVGVKKTATCEVCKKNFRPSNLALHLKRHSRAGDLLDSIYNLKSPLNKHLKTVHDTINIESFGLEEKKMDANNEVGTVIEKENSIEYALPYGWKKVGRKRAGDKSGILLESFEVFMIFSKICKDI